MQKKMLNKERVKKILVYTAISLLLLCVTLGLFALKAYAACAHQYVGGNCIHCGLPCQSCDTGNGQEYSYLSNETLNNHFVFKECTECGLVTSVGFEDCTFDIQDVCTKCGHEKINTDCIFHSFNLGKCMFCGFVCFHPSYDGGVCVLCRLPCFHTNIDMHYIQSTINLHKHLLSPLCADCDIGVVKDHSAVGVSEACSYDDEGVCTKCKRFCLHEFGFEDGKCSICDYGCKHSDGSTYTYEPFPGSISSHTITAWCNTCGECNTADSQNGVRVECTFLSGKCSKCKRTCEHSSVKQTFSSIPNDYAQHNVILTCNICSTVTSTSYGSHKYDMQNMCQECFLVCTHERWTDGICTYCKCSCAHSTYVNGKCSSCGFVCRHRSLTTTYTQIANDYALHNVITTCNICDMQTSTFADHMYSGTKCTACSMQCFHERWSDGKCRYCSLACQHIYEKSVCTICDISCAHPSILVRTVGTEKNHQQFYCTTCDFVSPLYEIPFAYTQYFSYLPAPCTWNANATLMKEKSSFRDYDMYFERYTINNFDKLHDYKASTHILGGSSITDSMAFDSPIIASRYLVLRVRFSGITNLEVYAYGGDSAVSYDDVVNQCSILHFYDIESLPDNEWFTLVVDMSLFDDVSNSTYSVGDSISHAFLTLCFTYEDFDSFADIAYFSLCDDLSDIDLVNNFSAIYPVSHEYYLADGRYSVNSTSSHDFDPAGRCNYCGYVCEHTNTYTFDVSTNIGCGTETRCALCDVLAASTVDGHMFADNSDTCSKCSYVCAHRYSGGVCVYCEWSCKHTHPDGSMKCSNCGYYVDYKGYDDKDGFFSLFTAIYDAQANTFFSLLGYEILGVNIAGLLVSVVSLAIVIWILKKVL